MPPGTKADTCRQYVLPKLYAADWDDERIAEQPTFTDGRIVVSGSKVPRRPGKRADYILRYRADMSIGVPPPDLLDTLLQNVPRPGARGFPLGADNTL